MLYSSGLFRTTLPLQVSADGLIWLKSAGYVKLISSGCIALLPPAVLVLEKISEVLRKFCREQGFWEIFLPNLQEMELWEKSGRVERFTGTLCETTLRDGKKYVINPTQEEAVINLFCKSGFRDKDLPLRFFQISERIRNEFQPSHGLIRSRSFVMGDMYILARDNNMLEAEIQQIEKVMHSFLSWLGLPFHRSSYLFSPSEVPIDSYCVSSVTRQCKVYVCSACGNSYRFGKTTLEMCPHCKGKMESISAVEIGDIMRHNTLITERMGAAPIDSTKPIYTAVGGIGLTRLLQILAEYYHDEQGLTWPIRIAPFEIHLIAIQERTKEAENLAQNLEQIGCKVLLDLRHQSIGRSLIDADLLGMPLRVVLARKTRAGEFDVKVRRTNEVFIGTIEALAERREFLYEEEKQISK